MPRPFPLYAKILLLFALNVGLLGFVALALVRAQFGLGRDWPLSAGANERIDQACNLILAELGNQPESKWDGILKRFNTSYPEGVQFLVFGEHEQLGGPKVELPPEVRQRLGGHRGPPHGDLGPPDGGPPGPEGEERPLPPPRDRMGPHDPRPKSMAHTSNPSRYWVVTRGMVMSPEEGHPEPVSVVLMSDTLSGGGLLFDVTPWLMIGAGAILISALLWLPLALGINRSISQMTRATAQIAEGRFEVRVNERRRDELGALGHAINQMAARLAGLVGGQKRFLGDVAHELCGPLAKLRVALGIIDQHAVAEQRGYVDQAEEEAGRVAELVNELLSFSKTALGASEVKLQAVSVAEAAGEAARREEKDGVKIALEVDAGLRVMAEPQLLTRAVANLLRNAIDYAGSAGAITVSARGNAERVEITVADGGPGVPEAELTKIFDPFYRLDASRDRATGGVGLGLAIVKTCVEACGGTVSARNQSPSGLEVTLELAAVKMEG